MALDLYSLARHCSPTVAPLTMVTLVKTESKGNPLAIGLNGAKLQYQPKTESQARAWLRYLDKHGYNFDVGLGQVNIVNIRKYKLKPEQLIDPCFNLRISAKILTENYRIAIKNTPDQQLALRQALSLYNTGNRYAGFNNGYLSKVITVAQAELP